jgi:hypothetical protein
MLERRAVAPFRALGLVHPPRREFILLTRLETIFENGSSVENLALLIDRVREDKRLVNALPRFALQVREYREKWFCQLSSEAMKWRLCTLLDWLASWKCIFVFDENFSHSDLPACELAIFIGSHDLQCL